jgi:hypothetical protein
MSLYGYARVSTLDQDLSIQRTALKAAGCEVIRAEKASGARRDGRSELQVLLEFLRNGDTLVVTRIDRLARSLKDLQDIVHELKNRGVALKATEQPVDTGTAAGKAFLDMLGVFAEAERVSTACSVNKRLPLGGTRVPMPIKPEMRGFYPNNWPEISRRVRFERRRDLSGMRPATWHDHSLSA